MKESRDEVLADAALAGDEDALASAPEPRRGLAHAHHRSTSADKDRRRARQGRSDRQPHAGEQPVRTETGRATTSLPREIRESDMNCQAQQEKAKRISEIRASWSDKLDGD